MSRITNIPRIVGPSFGGVIYGLSVSQSFSTEPTKLTLNIVNPAGSYTRPTLNQPATVSFGDFTFQGVIWSYEFKESADERTLEVVLIDNSIILDRKYVLLWKRGFLNENGQEARTNKTFDFSDESILLAVRDSKTGNINWVEKVLGKASQEAKKRDLIGKIKGSLILVGREKFPESECDIPDNYYTFDDLKNTISSIVNASNWPSNSKWRATHEGTLREVLSSWCADLGYDFYWDFSQNRLQFYDASRGITGNLPDSKASNIISKQTGSSMEGTFRQYGLAYTQKPKAPLKTLSETKVDKWNYSVSPVNMSYFAKKNGKSLNLSFSDGDSPYGGRTISELRVAGLVKYVNEDLRDIHCLYKGHHEALGWEGKELKLNNPKIIDFLKKFEMGEMIDSYEKFDAENLPNFEIWLIKRNEAIHEAWKAFEEKMLTYEGRFYRIPDRPTEFYYCSPKMTANISVSVDPAPSLKEPNSDEFAGRYIYDRGGGQMSHDSAKIQESLKLKDMANELEFCKPKLINLADAGLFEELMECTDIIKNKAEASKKNYLLICPTQKLFKSKLGFSAETTSGMNDLETTWIEEKNKSGMNKNCKSFEEALKAGSCATYEELARKKAVKNVGGIPADERPEPPDWVSGLNNKIAHGCKIKTQKGSATFYLPSHSTLRVITTANADVSKISTHDISEFTWTVGNPGLANDVAELRIANENITDPDEDTFQKKRNSELIRPADVDASSPNMTIKYVFAGEPQGISLNPTSGLSSLDTTLSSDGFTTSATFSTRPPKPSKQNNMVRYINSQFNRTSYNAS